MSDRFFVESPIDGDRAMLVDAEAHHLVHVMRAKPGDLVVLFDGSGVVFRAKVDRCGRSEVDCRVVSREVVDREIGFDLTLGVSLPKGDRQRWLVEKVTELGVTRLVPLITDRSVAQPNTKTLQRLRRAVIEASKQCWRNVLMEIAPPQRWGAFVANSSAPANRLIAHPGGQPLAGIGLSQRRDTVLAVGPEGGFAEAEIAAAHAANWQIADLGSPVLRTETAAIALAAFVACHSRTPLL